MVLVSAIINADIDSFQRNDGNVPLNPIWQSTTDTERQLARLRESGSSHNGIRVIMIIQSWAALLATNLPRMVFHYCAALGATHNSWLAVSGSNDSSC